MKSKRILSLLIFFFGFLTACKPLLNENLSQVSVDLSTEKPFSAERLNGLAKLFGDFMVSRFKASSASEPGNSCPSGSLDPYIDHLYLSAHFSECVDLSQRCLRPGAYSSTAVISGSRCAKQINSMDVASALVDKAFSETKGPGRQLLGLMRILSLESSPQTSSQAAKLFDELFPGRSRRDFLYFRSFREAVRGGNSQAFMGKDLDGFVNELKSWVEPDVYALMRVWQASILGQGDYKNRDSLVLLETILRDGDLDKVSLSDLVNLVSLIYLNLFVQEEAGVLAARSFYQAILPYTQPDFFLPTSMNPFTYTEISTTVCKDTVSSGDLAVKLSAIEKDYYTGSASLDQTRIKIDDFLKTSPKLADGLTLKGSLDLRQDLLEEAKTSFWQAHQLCPYYSRAHQGLVFVKQLSLAKRRPKYAEEKAKMSTPPANQNSAPIFASNTEASSYLRYSNFFSVPEKSILHNSMLFLQPFIPELMRKRSGILIADVFQKLSQFQHFRDAKDQRVPEYDQRLRDDIEGVASIDSQTGENLFLLGLPSLNLIPHGGGNIPLHEGAHQLHFVAPDMISQCIKSLYEAAKARNDFILGYASTNEYEYFAVSVEFTQDTPEKSATYQSWYRKRDPAMLELLSAIAASQGNLPSLASSFQCPDPKSLADNLSPDSADISLGIYKPDGASSAFVFVAGDIALEEALLCRGTHELCLKGGGQRFPLRPLEKDGDRFYFVRDQELKSQELSDTATWVLLGRSFEVKDRFDVAKALNVSQ